MHQSLAQGRVKDSMGGQGLNRFSSSPRKSNERRVFADINDEETMCDPNIQNDLADLCVHHSFADHG